MKTINDKIDKIIVPLIVRHLMDGNRYLKQLKFSFGVNRKTIRHMSLAYAPAA